MPNGGSFNMAEISKRCLRSLKERIRRFVFMHSDPDDVEVVLMIVSIHRYLMDPDFTTQTGLECDTETEVYDLIVTDFTNKMKCVLDPAINFLVQKGELLAGSRVCLRLSDCAVYFNEMDLDADSLLIIKGLRVLGSLERRINTDLIPYCGYPDDDDEDVPLVTGRRTYLALWNDVDLYGKYVEEQVPLSSGARLQQNTVSLKTLADNWKSLKRPYPALLVKVIHKSRLRFYGKPNKFDKWPYQIYLTVADESAIGSVVLWNELALELHSSLMEGVVMRMASYTVRRRFQLMSHPTLRVRNIAEVDFELSLNKHHPEGEITLVDQEDIRATWRLPALQYHFITRQHLSSLPDQYNVDVIGVVTFVGRVERIRKRAHLRQFWQYRWVELMDGTSPKPLRVELYATSQPQIQGLMLPNTVLVCTQMRLVHNLNDITSSHQQRALYVTTTNESQLYVHMDDVTGQYRSPIVKQLLQWSRSLEGQRAVKAAVSVGGYYCYPPLSTSLQGYKASLTINNPLTLVTGDKLATELSSLCCHEHRRLTIQGFLVHIHFVAPVSEKQGVLHGRDSYRLMSRKQTEEQQKNLGRKRKTQCPVNDAPIVQTVVPTSVLVDRTWSAARDNIETLGLTTAPPSFYQRRFLRRNESAMRSCLCMPASSYHHTNVKTKLEDLPKHASLGHFIVTIVGLNHQVALHALFPLPERISHNATVAGLLCGVVSEDRTEPEASEPTLAVTASLLQTAQHCHDKRMLFVLDLFRYRGDAIEIVLNRAFVIR